MYILICNSVKSVVVQQMLLVLHICLVLRTLFPVFSELFFGSDFNLIIFKYIKMCVKMFTFSEPVGVKKCKLEFCQGLSGPGAFCGGFACFHYVL